MLSDNEKKYVRGGKIEGTRSYKYELKSKVRKKAKEAIEELSLIAENVSEEEFRKIFTEERTAGLIESLLLPSEKLTDYSEYYASFKSKEGILKASESCLEAWYRGLHDKYFSQNQELLEGFNQLIRASKYYVRTRGNSGIVEAGDALEAYDKEVKTKERILRNCHKWRSKGEIAEAAHLPRDTVDEKVDQLCEEGKIKRQKNGYRYKRS